MSKLKRNHGDFINTERISENKSYIYKYILNTGGVYLRKVCKELGLAMGDTQYHLAMLEKEGRIKSRKIGQHRHYYPVTILDEQHELNPCIFKTRNVNGYSNLFNGASRFKST